MEPPRCSLQSFIKRVRGELRLLKGDRAREIVDFSIINQSDWQNYEAKIQGPDDTPYENGIFVLNIYLPRISDDKYKSYPFVPPNIIFKTKIFHPNISSKGDICLDNFHNGWNPGCTLERVLLSICVLLSEPNPNDFLVPEAAFLYKENRKEYDRKAREWTRKYAMENSIAVNVHQLKELMDSVNRMSVSSSSSGHTAQQEAIDIQPSRRRRTGRFNSIETLQVKTFDNGESKEYVPIIAQCLRSRDDRQEKDR